MRREKKKKNTQTHAQESDLISWWRGLMMA